MVSNTISGRLIGLVLAAAALLAGSAAAFAEDVTRAAATSQPAEGSDSLTVRYGCRLRGTAVKVIVHKDGKDLELSRDKLASVTLSPDKVMLADNVPCDCTLMAVRFSTATDPAHVALFKRKDITAIALDFQPAAGAASQPAAGGFSRERSADEVDKDLLRTNSDLLASHLAAAKDATKKAMAAIAAEYAPQITTAQSNVNDANAKYQPAAAAMVNAQNAMNNAAAQAAHTGGREQWWANREENMARQAYQRASKEAQSSQKDLNSATTALQTVVAQRTADLAHASSQSISSEAALREVSNMQATVLYFGGTLTADDMEANYTAEMPAADAPPAKPSPDSAPPAKPKAGREPQGS